MASSTPYPSIPIPQNDTNSMYQAILAMRQTIQLLIVNAQSVTGQTLTQASQIFSKKTDQANFVSTINANLASINNSLANTSNTISNIQPGTILPLMDGAATSGTTTPYARQDHVHPTDTSRYAASNPSGYQTQAQVIARLGTYMPLAGGTFTGTVSFSDLPHMPGGSAGQYLQTNGSGILSWVTPSSGGGISDVPSDSTTYARNNATWVHLTHNDITDWISALSGYALASNVPVASTTLPVMDGAVAVGTGTTWARADHIHPSDTSRAPLAGPTFTGNVTITNASTNASLTINPIVATNQAQIFGMKNAVARWSMQIGDATAEGGSNTGSNFSLTSRTDAGAVLSTVLQINRSNGQIIIPVANVFNAASDSAAATGGVPVGGVYRNGSVLMIRVA